MLMQNSPKNKTVKRAKAPQFKLKITLLEIKVTKKNSNFTALSTALIKRWITAALIAHGITITPNSNTTLEIAIKFVSKRESAALNNLYRHKDCPTNILSFPGYNKKELAAIFLNTPQINEITLGDLAICTPIVVKEAREQSKMCLAHLAHLIIHGTLHLLGYKHSSIKDAKTMENLEIAIIKELGYENPY